MGPVDRVANRCSFCGKSDTEIPRLISGPEKVGICSECVGMCNAIIDEDTRRASGDAISDAELVRMLDAAEADATPLGKDLARVIRELQRLRITRG